MSAVSAPGTTPKYETWCASAWTSPIPANWGRRQTESGWIAVRSKITGPLFERRYGAAQYSKIEYTTPGSHIAGGRHEKGSQTRQVQNILEACTGKIKDKKDSGKGQDKIGPR